MRGYDDLCSADRIKLLCGLAEILPDEEAESARATAWAIQAAEAQQIKFHEVLKASEPASEPGAPT